MSELDTNALNAISHEAEMHRVVLDLPASVQLTMTPLRTGQNADGSVRLELGPIGRVLASLRSGRWDDRRAKTLPLNLDELAGLIDPYDETVYGDLWNQPLETHTHWVKRVSADWQSDHGFGGLNRLYLFKNPAEGHLDVMIWFEGVRIVDGAGNTLSANQLASEVEDWWASMQGGETPDGSHGIRLLAPGQFRPWWKRLFRR